MEVLAYALSMILTTGASFAIVLLDERRLARVAPPLLDRAWPPTSRAAAIVAFGPIAVVIHFARTRRTVVGALLGFAAAGLVLAVDALAQWALDPTW